MRGFMREQGFGCCGEKSFEALEQYYENKLLSIAAEVLPGAEKQPDIDLEAYDAFLYYR